MTGMAAVTHTSSRRTPIVVLVTSVVLLVGSVIAAPLVARNFAGSDTSRLVGNSAAVGGQGAYGGGYGGMMGGSGTGMMGGSGSGMMGGSGSGMMAGRVWLSGDGVAVTTISAARARAKAASSAAGLHPGEVMQFSQNFYVELKDASGSSVTEVLVNPATGAVTGEPGPAMMWNTGSRTSSVSPEQATTIATSWLAANRSGETVGKIDAYPGYYTVDTTVAGTTTGMLSVNASTGAVWYHTWHGTFVAMEDV